MENKTTPTYTIPKLSLEDMALLLKQARSIVEDGWCQNAFVRNLHGAIHYCAVGAIRAAIDTYLGMPESLKCPATHEEMNEYFRLTCIRAERSDEVIRVVSKVLRASHGYAKQPPAHLAEYNDAPETTKADILVLFDAAIESVQHDDT